MTLTAMKKSFTAIMHAEMSDKNQMKYVKKLTTKRNGNCVCQK